jgi:hypothetical protein
MSRQPIPVSDAAITIIVQRCRPLTPIAQDAFLEAVATRLADVAEIGDGTVARACRTLLASGAFQRNPHFVVDDAHLGVPLQRYRPRKRQG